MIEKPYNKDEKGYMRTLQNSVFLINSGYPHPEKISFSLRKAFIQSSHMRLFRHEGKTSMGAPIPPLKIPDTNTNIAVGEYLGVAPNKTLETFVSNPKAIYDILSEMSKRESGNYGTALPLSASGLINQGLVLAIYEVPTEAYTIIRETTEKETKYGLKKKIDDVFKNN